MREGISGVVNIIENDVKAIAVKEFKAPYDKNRATYLDYENEVTTLTILSSYENDLPFEVSTILEHDLYNAREHSSDPIGFISMSALHAPLTGRELSAEAECIYKNQAVEAGKAVAKLHNIEISLKDAQKLKRNPVDVKVDFLKNHPMADQNKELIDDIVQKLRGMGGEKVFVHNDFHASNLFVDSMKGKIEAACDFCYAGMGIRELDFSFYTNYRDEFVGGYESISPNVLNTHNLDVMKAMELVFMKLNTDLELKDALDKLE